MENNECIYRKTMDELNNSIMELKYKIGYALVHKEKQGLKAWLWRNIGNLFHHRDWYEKGMEKYNPFDKYYIDAMKIWGNE
jgi:hypothetical protein